MGRIGRFQVVVGIGPLMVPCLQLVLVMRCLGVVVASLLLAACPGEVPIDPPHGDAGEAIPDGSINPGNGLTVTFALVSPIPIDANMATIERITFRAMSVRAIGDAASGDARTTQNDYLMKWTASESPAAIAFAEAPIGLYSSVAIQLAPKNGEAAWELHGECMRNNERLDFEIDSDEPLSLSVPVNEMLSPGGSATIAIQLDAAAVIGNIDWDAQAKDGDKVTIDEDSAAMPQIIAALRASLK